jgi:dihydroxy-acid dehydratase
MRNIGPVGAGMPEAGSIQIPRYLARQGVRDMVRISDGRMSSTAYGTIVLHVSPEAALGGPLALVRNGDRIRLDVPTAPSTLLSAKPNSTDRRAELVLPEPPERGGATSTPPMSYRPRKAPTSGFSTVCSHEH